MVEKERLIVRDAFPLALTDHIAQTNHTIDWRKLQLPMKMATWSTHGIKVAITNRKTGPHFVNRDGGHHQLPNIYSKLLMPDVPLALAHCTGVEDSSLQN